MQDFRSNPNEDFRQAYTATALEHDADEMEVELASPWQRMGARIMDGLPFAGIGILAAILLPIMGGSGGGAAMALIIVALLAILGLLIYNLVIMTRDGQSIGKKIIGIRVITEDGDNPGFVKYVLVREFAYNMIFTIIGLFSEALGNLLAFVAAIVCIVMLFRESSNRQTLQDLLAKTLVIKN
ncbi:RDD family protein [Eikenella sp. S3360]|uniref:RDD family protein n=1 Tax=Eikenella glucosivorans TaxID=2766967 RepID=A0ABS0NB33_9NEIS|nr:RDD family protein [Eikenella glucosivorans]MBH5329518.1 RDD family protein [Eikenella glucosivorans]